MDTLITTMRIFAYYRNRGLLVDGNTSNISADDITVSSSYNNNHGSNKARIQTTGSEGAWCPGKCINRVFYRFAFTFEGFDILAEQSVDVHLSYHIALILCRPSYIIC